MNCSNCGEHFKRMEKLYHHDKEIVCSTDCAYELGERRGAEKERERIIKAAKAMLSSAELLDLKTAKLFLHAISFTHAVAAGAVSETALSSRSDVTRRNPAGSIPADGIKNKRVCWTCVSLSGLCPKHNKRVRKEARR